MTALLTVSQIRAVETAAAANLPAGTLMRRAGRAVAQRALLRGEGPFLVLAGPGNNGGDAFEAAYELAQAHRKVQIIFLGEPERLPSDAAAAWRRCVEAGLDVGHSLPARIMAPVIIDGLFGIGLARPLSQRHGQAVSAVNAARAYVIAIDVPSGIDADTGAVVGGGEGCAIRADETVSFIADKPGLHTGAAVDHTGKVLVDALGIDLAALNLPALADPRGRLNGPAAFAGALRLRARNSHKGRFGSVAILGGSTSMGGAAHLAARAALYAGAGRVYLHPLGERLAFDPLFPELMIRSADALDPSHVVVAGPGLGLDVTAHGALAHVLDEATRAVLDADALNLIARDADLGARMRARARRTNFLTLMTPHPLEAARLLGMEAEHIAADRIGAALKLAQNFDAVVVLKGAGSVVAAPDGRWVVNPTGNPGLATAGTGDVLAGLTGALLAAGAETSASAAVAAAAPTTAAMATLSAAVWLHGAAADALVARGVGPIGLTASELLPEIRRLINELAA